MRAFAALIAGCLVAGLTQAADHEAVARCAAEPRDAERLACYDALFRTGAVAGGQGTALPPPALTPEQRFGLDKREKAARERATSETQEPDELRVAILGTETRDQGRLLVLKLANGQVWQQAESVTLPTIRSGDTVLIERGALGSYLARINGRAPSFRVKRLK